MFSDKCLRKLASDLLPYLMPYVENRMKDSLCSKESTSDEQEFLTKDEVITRYRVSAMTLWRLEKKGELIPMRLGRKLFYRPMEVEKIFK